MTEIYSVVAAFGSNADAEGAVLKLTRSGLQERGMSIENRVSPIQQGTSDVYRDGDVGSSAIAGALLGGLWGFLVNGDRFLNEKEDVLPMETYLSCLGFALKGACIFAGVTFVNLSMKSEISSLRLLHKEPTITVDPYLLVVHGTPTAVTLAGDVLRAV